jgi:hypothetical protein
MSTVKDAMGTYEGYYALLKRKMIYKASVTTTDGKAPYYSSTEANESVRVGKIACNCPTKIITNSSGHAVCGCGTR